MSSTHRHRSGKCRTRAQEVGGSLAQSAAMQGFYPPRIAPLHYSLKPRRYFARTQVHHVTVTAPGQVSQSKIHDGAMSPCPRKPNRRPVVRVWQVEDSAGSPTSIGLPKAPRMAASLSRQTRVDQRIPDVRVLVVFHSR